MPSSPKVMVEKYLPAAGFIRFRRAPRLSIAGGGARCLSTSARDVYSRIDFIVNHQVGGLVTQVGKREDPVVAELVLQAGVPGCSDWRVVLRFQEDICSREGEDIIMRRKERQGKRIAAGDISPWIDELVRAAGIANGYTPWRILTSNAVGEEGPQGVIEKSWHRCERWSCRLHQGCRRDRSRGEKFSQWSPVNDLLTPGSP